MSGVLLPEARGPQSWGQQSPSPSDLGELPGAQRSCGIEETRAGTPARSSGRGHVPVSFGGKGPGQGMHPATPRVTGVSKTRNNNRCAVLLPGLPHQQRILPSDPYKGHLTTFLFSSEEPDSASISQAPGFTQRRRFAFG